MYCMRKPKIELYADKGGKFRFRVIAANGEPVAMGSEAYETLASAKSTAKKLAGILAKAELVDTTKPAPAPKKAVKPAKKK